MSSFVCGYKSLQMRWLSVHLLQAKACMHTRKVVCCVNLALTCSCIIPVHSGVLFEHYPQTIAEEVT